MCQKCWEDGSDPEAWHESLVVAIFKKGDTADCANYRPISLLPIGYKKLFALVLLERLKSSGAEDRVWNTQYGFKSGYGTRDSLHLARRMLDRPWETKDGKLVFLALDWAKAFDSVCPDSLVKALQRFGIHGRMLAAMKAIYQNRMFRVRDGGRISEPHEQQFGICQRCPLYHPSSLLWS